MPRAGRELARRVDHLAQDRSIRLLRTRVPEANRLPDAFARWGYLPISRDNRDDVTTALQLVTRRP